MPSAALIEQVRPGSPEDTPHRSRLRNKAVNSEQTVALIALLTRMMIKDPPVRDSHHDQTPYR